MYFRVLGSVSIDGAAPLTALMQRRLLAALLCKANESVPADELVSALWGADGPVGVRKTLQVYMRRLRLALGDDRRILHDPAGYRITVAPDELDTFAFARLTREGRLEEALGLWRGRAYEDVRDYPPVADEARRLDEERLRVEVQFVTAELEQSRHQELIPRLRRMTEEHPFREDFRGHLMLAFYRAGRHSEALDIYIGTRKLLAEELGVDPGPELQRLHAAILRRAPELDLASTAPRELPADSVEFVGRLEQLAMLDTMLDSTAPVVISAIAGSAGVGKTALAVHWAARVAERFPDGQLYLNLNGFSSSPPMRPIEALASMLRSIGVPPEKISVEEAAAVALFRTQMSARRMLLVLDNAKSAEQVRPLLPSGSGTLVLITSRNSLGGLVAREGARRLSLDVLPPEEAFALLARLLGASRVAASPAAVADLARACAYLPLALRVAAASLLDRPHRSVASHVSALLSRGPLDALAIEDDPATAVRAAFDQSYLDIPPEVQRTFRLLGLIPGPDFTAPAVAALADLPLPQADRHLARLTSAHLIHQIGPDRYTFHDLLRVYAAERAAADPAEANSATVRLYDWYLRRVYATADLLFPGYLRLPAPAAEQVTSRFCSSKKVAMEWLDADGHNLVCAISHAASRGPQEYSWLLAGALRWYFARSRHLEGWLPAAQAALAAAETCEDTAAIASSHLALAQTYQAIGEAERAQSNLAEAIRLSRLVGWRQMEAACLGNMGGILLEIGNMDEAEHFAQLSLQVKQHIGWKQGQLTSLGNIATITLRAGRLRKAERLMRKAIAVSGRADQSQSANMADLGKILSGLGHSDEALDWLHRALATKKEIGDRLGEARTLMELADVYLMKSQISDAREFLRQGLEIAQELRSTEALTMATIIAAEIDVAAGVMNEALVNFRRAYDMAHGFSGSRYPRALAGVGLAGALCVIGDYDAATQHTTEVLNLARQAGFRVVEGRALTLLCRIAVETGRRNEAAELSKEALRSHRITGYAPGLDETLWIIKEWGLINGD